jgi:DNA-binding CsgD family transcriptional regulator
MREDGRLQALIGRALVGDTPHAGAVRLSRRSGRAPYIVTVYPLVRSQCFLAPSSASALLTIVDPVGGAAMPAGIYREVFGLSPREAELAALLMAGHSIESAATNLRIRLPTARIHMRQILAKTGTARQSDVVRLLSRLR